MVSGCQQFEVAVIGGGPAGSAAAITLARAGHQVLLIEKNSGEEFKIGEGLPPAAKPLLRELGVMDQFNADRHLPSFGNESAWGSSVLSRTDFIRDPYGHGWHLDRPRFDAMLRAEAQNAGAIVQDSTHLTRFQRDRHGCWTLTLVGKEGTQHVRSPWLIDCTGRRHWVARSQGGRRTNYDRLVGFAALFRTRVVGQKEDSDSLTLIESVVDGWWYTALLPNKRRVVVYFTDAGTEASKSAGNEGGYMALLEKTRYIRRRITMNNYTIECCPRITSANSSRLERIFGDGWLACGDAAASFDPLSSQGILTAIYSGIKAGRALHLSMSGALHTLDLYCRNLNAIYDIYLRNRKIYYSSERRWPESEFWRRRQGAEEKDEG